MSENNSDNVESNSNTITKEMGIMDIVQKHPESVEVFMEHGMHCIGCAAAHFENLDQGCQAHGIDSDKLVQAINKKIKVNSNIKSEKNSKE